MAFLTGATDRASITPGKVLVVALAILPWSWWLVRDLSPYMELLAIGAPPIMAVGAIASGVVALRRRSVRSLVAVASWLIAGTIMIVAALRPTPGPPPRDGIDLYAINVTGQDGDNVAIAEAVVDADLVVASELTRFLSRRLSQRFPHHVVLNALYNTSSDNDPDLGVYSRFRVTPLLAPSWLPGQRVRVDGPSGPFILYAVHVPQPGFTNGEWRWAFPRRARLIRQLAAAAEGERLPTVIAGDLNATDRGADYRHLTRSFDDAVRTRWAAPTSSKSSLVWRSMLLRIDHILHSPDLCSETGGRLDLPGSEHRGVRARLGACPAS